MNHVRYIQEAIDWVNAQSLSGIITDKENIEKLTINCIKHLDKILNVEDIDASIVTFDNAGSMWMISQSLPALAEKIEQEMKYFLSREKIIKLVSKIKLTSFRLEIESERYSLKQKEWETWGSMDFQFDKIDQIIQKTPSFVLDVNIQLKWKWKLFHSLEKFIHTLLKQEEFGQGELGKKISEFSQIIFAFLNIANKGS